MPNRTNTKGYANVAMQVKKNKSIISKKKHHNRCNDQMQDDTQQDMRRERHMSVNEQSPGRMLDILCLDTEYSGTLPG